MGFSGAHVFDYDAQIVWDALMDPEILAYALPGKAQLQSISGDALAWQVKSTLRLAGMATDVIGVVRLNIIEPVARYVLLVEADSQHDGVLYGQAEIALVASADENQSRTTVNWQGEFAKSSISSFMAQIVSPVIVGAARQFFVRIEARLKENHVA
jgi:carbon monoxide dehydrogenase subunit G